MLLPDLPYDILELVFHQLDARSATVCGELCRKFRAFITTSLPVQYKIALARRGMSAGRNESIDLAERLAKVEQYERAWREASWEESFALSLLPPRDNCKILRSQGYMLLWTARTSTVRLIRLPSPLCGITSEEHVWCLPSNVSRHRDDEGNPTNLYPLMDVDSDLIIFVDASGGPEAEVQLLYPRSLLTGDIHPWCAGAVEFSLKIPSTFGHLGAVDLHNRYISLGAVDESGPFMVYDWLKRKKVIQFDNPVKTSFLGFFDGMRFLTFATDESGRCCALEVYDLGLLSEEPPTSDAAPRVPITHRFELPFHQVGTTLARYDEETWALLPNSANRSDCASYFREDELITIYFPFMQGRAALMNYTITMTFDLSALISSLHISSSDHPGTRNGMHVIPWNNWHGRVRIGVLPSPFSTDIAITGWRVIPDLPSLNDGHVEVRVHDSHPLRTRRAGDSSATPSCEVVRCKCELTGLNSRKLWDPPLNHTLLATDYVVHTIKLPSSSAGSSIGNKTHRAFFSRDAIIIMEYRLPDISGRWVEGFGLTSITAYQLV
ncbi:unnamed protein product [Peniophora sp. CBMAI 1063]|nr:unnamed protein product [Peniophora sp. CBMAI 1063]